MFSVEVFFKHLIILFMSMSVAICLCAFCLFQHLLKIQSIISARICFMFEFV